MVKLSFNFAFDKSSPLFGLMNPFSFCIADTQTDID